MSSDFQAVVLCGPGKELYPITPSNDYPKALLPVANRPMIEQVLRWIDDAGLTDVLLLAPASQRDSLQHFLRKRKQENGLKIELEVHGDEEVESTASIVNLAAQAGQIKGDFVVLPCDLAIRPQNSDVNLLAKLIADHRASDHLVSAVMSERPLPKDDKEAKKDKPTQLVLYDGKTKVLLDVKQLEDFDDEIPIRQSLFMSYPSTTASTRLDHAHVFICSRRVLDILAAIDRFDSFRAFVAYLAKAQWQAKLLSTHAAEDKPLKAIRHPQALAMSHSSTTPSPIAPLPSTSTAAGPSKPARPRLATHRQSTYGTLLKSSYSSNDVRPSDASPRPPADAAHWPRSSRVSLHIWRPATDGICLRARTTSAYAEMNRLALKAYTEPEGVLGQHVTQGEKVSIKRCAVGDHCSLAKYAKLSGSVLFESVVVGGGCVPLVVPGAWGNAAYRAKLENCIVAKGVRIGEHATLKDCEIGEGCVIAEGIQLKGERVALD